MKYVTWKKGLRAELSEHFSTWEFECRCSFPDCGEQKVAVELVKRLEAVRKEYGKPITVTSGFRCNKKQESLRAQGYETAVGTSSHELGQAADITATQLTPLYPVVEKHFQAIGQARSFLHVDLRDDKRRRWSYSS
jgi:zinc D-Ala-D-Ala carboxypeptidase